MTKDEYTVKLFNYLLSLDKLTKRTTNRETALARVEALCYTAAVIYAASKGDAELDPKVVEKVGQAAFDAMYHKMEELDRERDDGTIECTD